VRRRLLNLLTLASLVLCVAVCVLWVRSYSVEEGFFLTDEHNDSLYGASYSGSVSAGYNSPFCKMYRVQGPLNQWQYHSRPAGNRIFAWLLGDVSAEWNDYSREATVPYWMLVTALALRPAAVAARRRRSRLREHLRLCRSCGYDLTGNVSGVCPECGSPAGVTLA
jgi:hypothetical protein